MDINNNLNNFEVEIYEEKKMSKKKTELVEIEKSKSYYDNEDIKYFKREEYQGLITTAKNFYRMVYLLLFETGARIEEARSLKFGDIDFHSNKVKLLTLKQRTNNNTYRFLIISNDLKSLILLHKMDNIMNNEDYILAKKTGSNAISNVSIYNQLQKDCERLDIDKEKASCHTFRHSRAVQLLEAGTDIVKLQRFLGHKNIQNSLIYLRICDVSFDKSIVESNLKIGLK